MLKIKPIIQAWIALVILINSLVKMLNSSNPIYPIILRQNLLTLNRLRIQVFWSEMGKVPFIFRKGPYLILIWRTARMRCFLNLSSVKISYWEQYWKTMLFNRLKPMIGTFFGAVNHTKHTFTITWTSTRKSTISRTVSSSHVRTVFAPTS